VAKVEVAPKAHATFFSQTIQRHSARHKQAVENKHAERYKQDKGNASRNTQEPSAGMKIEIGKDDSVFIQSSVNEVYSRL
jgi:hypothetical protein